MHRHCQTSLFSLYSLPRGGPCRPAGRAVVGIPGRKKAHGSELHDNGVAAPRLAVPSARNGRPRQQVVQVSKGALQDVVEAVQVDLAEQHACMASPARQSGLCDTVQDVRISVPRSLSRTLSPCAIWPLPFRIAQACKGPPRCSHKTLAGL